jgi:hypothetical protein
MTRRNIWRAAFSILVIFSAAVALGLLTGSGFEDIAILIIVGASVSYVTMRLIDRSPT